MGESVGREIFGWTGAYPRPTLASSVNKEDNFPNIIVYIIIFNVLTLTLCGANSISKDSISKDYAYNASRHF